MNYSYPFLLCILLIFSACKSETPSRHKALKKFVFEINNGCPIQLDSDTRLDSVTLSKDDNVQFNQTVWIDTFKYDIREFNKSLMEAASVGVKTSHDIKLFEDNSAILEYHYFDTLGNKLFSFVLPPEKYSRNTSVK